MRTSQYRKGRHPNSLKNLKRNADRDPEELREMGHKGGIASGKVRKNRARLRRVLEKAIEFYLPICRTAYCTFADIAEESGIPYHEEPRLVWLTLALYADLEAEHKRDLMTPETLRAMGLTEERAAEILHRWKKAMETPDDMPDDMHQVLSDEYREALKGME